MTTTKTSRETSSVPEVVPTLRMIFSGERVLADAPVFVLPNGPTPLGRDVSPREGISLHEDDHASRIHAHVHIARDSQQADAHLQIHITDAQSKNGTFVNGQRIAQQALEDGDLIRVGDTFLVLRVEQATLAEDPSGLLLGRSPSIRAARQEILRVAPSAATVLLLGESGTGKELAAKTIHELRHTAGRTGAFIAVNCAAIPDSLAEDQLFGHVAGAFSDARTASEGYFRAAHGGTLFLDEIGELPLGLQAKLLRALEDKAVTPVGAARPIACDVRLIAATNRSLLLEAHEGRFRGDLYSRLAALPIELPSLRARREDILFLLTRLWDGPVPRLSARLAAELLLYRWPYNVRELVQLAVYLSVHARDTDPLDLPLIAHRLGISPEKDQPARRDGQISRLPPPTLGPPISREELLDQLIQCRGVIANVGRVMGRDESAIRRWMKTYKIDKQQVLLTDFGKADIGKKKAE